METTSTAGKYRKVLIITGVIVLFLIPVLFLFFKSDMAGKPAEVNKAEEIARLENLVRTTPNYPNLVNLSVAYINNNLPQKATPYLDQALQLMPNSAVVFNNLGVINIMTRNYQEAISFCLKAIAVDGNFELAKNNLKWAIGEVNKTKTQIAEMEKKPLTERNTDYYILLGLNYQYLGEYNKSISVWDEGLKKDANNVVFLNNIGTALVMKKQYDEAIVKFRQVLDIEPANQLAKNNMAWATAEKTKNTKE